MKFSTLILVILICVLVVIGAIYHEQLSLVFKTLFCLLASEGIGCTLLNP